MMSLIFDCTRTHGWIRRDVHTSSLLRTSHQMIEVILSSFFDKTSCIFFCLI